MTPKEALEMLEQVAAKYLGTKADHALLDTAIEVLKKLIESLKGEQVVV